MPKAWIPNEDIQKWLRSKFIFDPVSGVLSHAKDDPSGFFCAGDQAGFLKRCGYLAVSIHNAQLGVRRKQLSVHRIVWFLHYGVWPEHDIDHINLNKLDNRLENLRAATLQQNSVNSAKRRTWNGRPCLTRLKGAYFHAKSGRWYSTIKISGKSAWLGWYDTEEEAAAAYATAATKHHGEYARPYF